MKKLPILFSLCLIGHSASALPSFDSFDANASGATSYSPGENLIGQNNSTLFGAWYSRGGNFPGAQPLITSGNLKYPNMPSSKGNSVVTAVAHNLSACLDLNLPTGAHTNAVYYSFVLKVTDISAVPTYGTNNPIVAFLDDPSAIGNRIARLGTRLLVKKVGSGYVLGTTRSDNVPDFVFEPDAAAHAVNEIVFVVGRFQATQFVQTNANLWINPPASSFGSNQPPAPTLTAPVSSSSTGALNTNYARAFGILCQNNNAGAVAVIDDVRLATNDWVHITGGDPAVGTDPADTSLPPGANATFTVGARGTPTLTYQWVKDGITFLNDGGKYSGTHTATLHVNSISGTELGSYAVYVTNGLGNFALSSSAQLAFSDPAITSQPQSRTNDYNTAATFQVTAIGSGTLTYQWRKEGVGDLSDGGNISGSHGTMLSLSGVTYLDAGDFTVVVTGSAGSVTSSVATLTVRDPIITTQPQSVTNNAGTTAMFHAAATGSGSGSFTYQWLRNGAVIFDSTKYAGTSTDTLSVLDVQESDEAGYSLSVVGAGGTATSSEGTLTVTSPVAITAQPTPRNVLAGTKTSFAVGISGTGPFRYRWTHSGTNLPNSDSYAFTIASAQASDAGSYSVIISNSLNMVTSSPVSLTLIGPLSLPPTNLVVLRVGDGPQLLTANGNSMFLDQFTRSGTYVSTLNIPESGTNSTVTLGPNTVPVPSSVTASTLSRSLDGRFIVIAGYHTTPGYGSELNSTTASDVPRGIGFVDSSGTYRLALASTDSTFNSTFFRSAVSDGTNNFWGAARSPGTYYFGFDAAAALVQNQFSNIRSMGLFNGNIYCVSAVNGNNGVLKLAGMPTVNSATEGLFAGSTGSSDLEVSPDGNVIYLADDRAAGNDGGVQRWEFNGSWSLAYTLTNGLANGARYVAADFSGANPIVCAITREATDDNNRIVIFQDTGSGSAGTTVTYAGANQNFRGARFGPTVSAPGRPTLSFTRQGNNIILSWSGAFTLMSATNVTGPYLDIAGATNPYTNSMTSPVRRFFGLRQ